MYENNNCLIIVALDIEKKGLVPSSVTIPLYETLVRRPQSKTRACLQKASAKEGFSLVFSEGFRMKLFVRST